MKFKIKNFLTNFWPYFLIIALIVTPWFLKPGYLFLTDNVWGPIIILDWHNAWFILNLIIKALSFIFSIAFLEKVFITAILTLVLMSGRALVKEILRDDSKGLVFVLSLFALFNPYVYDRALYGQFGVIAAYGFLLFTLTYLLRSYRTLDLKYLIKASIFSSLVLMFSLHFVFFLVPFYLLFFLSLYFKRQKISYKKLTLNLLASVFIVIIINANWLLALVSGSSSTANFIEQGISQQDLIAFQTSGNTPLETFSNVLLMSGFWGKDQYRYLNLTDISGWQRSFIFLTPIILYGLFLSFWKKNKQTKIFNIGLLIIFVLAVCLAVCIKSPLTNSISMFLYDHLPFYKGLREPQKWVAVIIPIYLYYLTIGASKLSTTKFINNNKVVIGLILGAIIIMSAPSLLWGFNHQVKSTPYPADWYQADKFIVDRSPQSASCNDRILFLPWHMYMNFSWVGKIIANPATAFFTCPVISGTNMEWGGIYDNSQDQTGKVINTWLNEQGKNGAPTISKNSPRYIILAKELDFKSYVWLNDKPYLELILETPTLFIYEIKY